MGLVKVSEILKQADKEKQQHWLLTVQIII